MNVRTIERRLEALEQALKPVRYGPSFIMASSRADSEIERLRVEYPDRMLEPPFVMILAKREASGETNERASLLLGIERLAHRYDLSAGRLIVVGALLGATLAEAGISRTDQDLVVKLKRYDPRPSRAALRPPVRDCAPPPPPGRKRGDPKPQAEPGEQLTIISWAWEDEEPTEPSSTIGQEAP
jgi:hypothetical protein